MQGTGDTSDHLQQFRAQHSKPQKTGMNRAPCLGNANIFIILPRHRTLALHWRVLSSLEAGHMLEPTPSCRWWIVKQGNTQMRLHGNPVEEQWPQINLLDPAWAYRLLRCYTTCIVNADINVVSPGSQPGLSRANWLSINILLFKCPLVSLLEDAQPLESWTLGFKGSGNHSRFVKLMGFLLPYSLQAPSLRNTFLLGLTRHFHACLLYSVRGHH